MTPILGCDYSAGRPNPEALYAAGIRFACRYVTYSPYKPYKLLTRAEADALRAAGINVVSNWERSEGDMLKGRDVGISHARTAEANHLAAGGDPDAPIYFSHDVDPNVGSLAPVMAYLDGAASVIGHHRVGIYGGWRAIATAVADGHAAWFWQCQAWSKFDGVIRWHPAAHIRQVVGAWVVDGVALDRNWAQVEHYGQWFYAPSLPQEDNVLLTRYQCTDADAAFIGWGVLVAEGITVPLQVEWANIETDADYVQWIQHRQAVHSTDARYWTFIGDVGALSAADTRRNWAVTDFRMVVPAAA